MQTTKNTSRTLKKLFGVVVAGAFAIAPFAGVVTSAQAAPTTSEHREYQTLEGVVTVDTTRKHTFILRLNNGRRIRVRTDSRKPVRLSNGDRVRVGGFYRRNQPNSFRADTVKILDNRNDGNSRTFRGRVVDVGTDQRFDIDVNGRIYNVTASTKLPRGLNEGDEVRVYGRRSGDNNIVNATVVITKNDGGDDNDDNNDYRTYTGRVVDVETDQRFDIDVNGTTYNVIASTRLPRRLNEGDRVRVYGRRSGDNNITNATITIIKNDKDDNDDNNYRTYTGRVVDVESDQRFDIVVGSTTYNVITTSRLPRRLTDGDRVRVYGQRDGDNNIVNATVTILDNNSDNDARTYTGRVVDVESDQNFDISVNGTTYNVFSAARLPRGLNVGDQVRVSGQRDGDNNILNATVTVLSNNGNNNNNGNSNDFRTFTGRVTEVQNDTRFELRVNGTDYDVVTASIVPRGLKEGDTVRVYGRRNGENNITNATVTVLDND